MIMINWCNVYQLDINFEALREITCYEKFLLFSQCYHKSLCFFLVFFFNSDCNYEISQSVVLRNSKKVLLLCIIMYVFKLRIYNRETDKKQ